ncbi:MAG: aminotransferase [Rickettsiales bacterium]|nr:aminotransferase [Rickettsiales bacterium]
MIYLDYNANAPVFKEVIEIISTQMKDYGNPSAIHTKGKKLDTVVDKCRQNFLDHFNAPNCKIIFTSSGTESNNVLLKKVKDIDYFFTLPSEHASVLESRNDFRFIPVDNNGIIELSHLERQLKKINKKKFLISVMLVNNENGIIQPIDKIVSIVKKYGGLIHCDGAQAIGKIDIDFNNLGIDALTLSGHKFGGPIGVAALIFNNNISIDSFLQGGEQELGIRSGTINTPLISGFNHALDLTKKKSYDKIMKTIFGWQNELENRIIKAYSKAIIFGKGQSRVGNVTQFCIPGIQSESIIFPMDVEGIYISSGSSCSSKIKTESHVVKSMNYSEQIYNNTIRVSWGWKSKKNELSIFMNKLKEIIDIYKAKAA